MKTYAYTKPELNLTITITPKAWAWAERRYSTPAVYADHQAAQFLAGRAVDNDVVIEWITKPCETESDRGGVAVAQAQPPVTVQPVINAAPVVESAPAETVWLAHTDGTAVCFYPPGSKGMYCRMGCRAEPNSHTLNERSNSGWLSSEWCRITPAKASKWLRANGHASVADEIDAAEMYEPVGTLPVVGDVVDYIDQYCITRSRVASEDICKREWLCRMDDGTHWIALARTFKDGAAFILKRKGPTNG